MRIDRLGDGIGMADRRVKAMVFIWVGRPVELEKADGNICIYIRVKNQIQNKYNNSVKLNFR